MTEAGWTREKPTVAGWYWYQGDTDLDAVVVWVAPNMHLINLSHRGPVRAFDGEWLGPITPDSYQQGRAAGLNLACIAVSQFSSDGEPIDANELRIALVQLLGELAKQ